jgi:hypothetical protein
MGCAPSLDLLALPERRSPLGDRRLREPVEVAGEVVDGPALDAEKRGDLGCVEQVVDVHGEIIPPSAITAVHSHSRMVLSLGAIRAHHEQLGAGMNDDVDRPVTHDGPYEVVKYGVTMPIRDEEMDPEFRTTQLIEWLTAYGITVEELEAASAYGGTGPLVYPEPCRTEAERRERARALLGDVTYRGRVIPTDDVPQFLADLHRQAQAEPGAAEVGEYGEYPSPAGDVVEAEDLMSHADYLGDEYLSCPVGDCYFETKAPHYAPLRQLLDIARKHVEEAHR